MDSDGVLMKMVVKGNCRDATAVVKEALETVV
jgi:hypothetical protein